MEAIVRPEAWIARYFRGSQVAEDRAAAGRGPAQRRGEPIHAGAEDARQRHDRSEVGEGEGDDGGAAGNECLLHGLDIVAHHVGVEMPAQQVVRSRYDGRQVGSHRHGRRELLVADLLRRPSAHGKIRIEDRSLLGGEPFGQAIGPAAVSSVAIRIVQPFGRAVADGDVALESRQAQQCGRSFVTGQPGRRRSLRSGRSQEVLQMG